MTATRTSIGNYCYKKSCTYILNKCGFLDAKNLIIHASIKLLHNIITSKQPNALYTLYKNPESRRAVVDIRPKYNPKSKALRQSLLYSGIKYYNSLPRDIKMSKNFKQLSKVYLCQNNVSDTLD